jgi:hypothetical protein
MRTSLLVASLLVASALIALVATRRDSDSAPVPRTGAVTLVGDSLNVGIEPYLPSALEGWTITNRNEVGRRTDAGLDVLRDEGRSLARRVVISLGTNDPPDGVDAYRRQVRAALAIAGRGRCVVWINMSAAHTSFQALDAVLDEEARRVDNLRVVDWAGLLAEHPDWLAADGVHGTEAGYRGRAEAVADAVRGCRVAPEVQPAP